MELPLWFISQLSLYAILIMGLVLVISINCRLTPEALSDMFFVHHNG